MPEIRDHKKRQVRCHSQRNVGYGVLALLPSAPIYRLPCRDKFPLEIGPRLLRQWRDRFLRKLSTLPKFTLDPLEVFGVIGGAVDQATLRQCAM